MSIPTTIITGFLGSGKTTAILNWLSRKPSNENWAILVNEFGEVGIDGAIMSDSGALIKEVPGGCMCCAAGVPTSVALTALLRQQPDRLIIEPTGLGHPEEIIALLQSEQFAPYLTLQATITLVEPKHLGIPRYIENANFQQQLDVADVVIGSKDDQATEHERQHFNAWIEAQHPPKLHYQFTEFGKLPLSLLDLSRSDAEHEHVQNHHHTHQHHHDHAEQQPQFALSPQQRFIRRQNHAQGYYSCGWIFGAEFQFPHHPLLEALSRLDSERIKGVINTDEGCFSYNNAQGMVTLTEMTLEGFESRLELINPTPLNWDAIEATLCQLVEI
jgi:G3E family GTPase